MKITSDISKQIYELSKDPKSNVSNQAIADKFGITEGSVRHHVRKWERQVHEIAKSDDQVAKSLSKFTINTHEECDLIIKNIKSSIQMARNQKVSPEKLAPLFSNWLKGLELASQLLGDIKSPMVEIQFNQLKTVIVGELCDNCKTKLKEKLYEIVSQ